ncbi:CU044_2847 family protein [uncultured Amnibacterium sp.]|uniref:CU044_2847 family protein n=1 Tax=uncultured Amnibacterium sp. TaxID=1631851 RepID=UPI0035C9D741
MTAIGRYLTEDGSVLLVELDSTDDAALPTAVFPVDSSGTDFTSYFVGPRGGATSEPVSGGGNPDPAFGKFEDALQSIAHLTTKARQVLTPDEVAVQLSFKLSGTVGWFVAKSSAEGAVQLTVTWKSPAAPLPAKD